MFFLSEKFRNWFFITCFLCVFVDISAQKNTGFSGTLNCGNESKQDPLTCSLDGKENSKEQYGGIDKYSIGRSGDRKIMTLKCVRTVNGSDYRSIESYSLSPDGRILTIKDTDLKGESPVIEVYNKK